MNDSKSSVGGSVPDATPSGNPEDVSAPIDLGTRSRLPFPVVGIGASAGGIQALRTFFEATSAQTGMAYIVVLHLSPEHDSLMAEILGRYTSMPVHQIEDAMPIEPNHVYVIRPGHTVTLAEGALHLGQPVEKRGFRHPVDDFFRSLAREQQESAIAVVLTGMGTNGTAGAQAIKAAGGLCIAQDPESAEFPAMPRSLIHAGYADQVLRIEEIPAMLQRYVRHPFLPLNPAGRARAAVEFEKHRQQLTDILTILRTRTGHDFAPYKPPTVLRRIHRRMGLLGITDLSEYGARLRTENPESAALANDLMINVTGFFRDPEAWEALRIAVVRPMVEARGTDEPIRAWVTACASGEEAYTLAMLIDEESQRARRRVPLKIFATDTADKSLALARSGLYPGGIEGDLAAERLEHFFESDEHTYRVKKELRERVVFASHDVLRDPPFSRVDIVTCRNLLIYLEPEAQRRALTLLHFALRDGGYLLLGNAESLGQADELFEVVSKRWRIYRRVGQAHRVTNFTNLPARLPELRYPLGATPNVLITRPSATTAIQLALLEKFGPPTAVVDANERVVYFHGDSSRYLMQPSGEITQNLLEMLRPVLRSVVRGALREAMADKREVVIEQSVADESTEQAAAVIRVTAAPLRLGRAPEHYRVSFEEKDDRNGQKIPHTAKLARSSSGARQSTVTDGNHALEEEIRALRRDLQSNVEAYEATHEELKASNEEVTSVNEELQSTNEELETGKEELQSLNEELSTVNSQLQDKVLELEGMTNDLSNLLSSTDIAVVFLDMNLNVRGFTPAISDLLELIPADIGRPLAHLAQKFTDGNLLGDAAQVIAKLVPLESEVHSHSGRWYLRRTLPYRTNDHRIAGAVVTFIDISARKQAEESIKAAQSRLQGVIEQLPAAVLVAEAPSGALLLGNRRAALLFGQPFPLPVIGSNWTAAYATFRGSHQDGRPYESAEWPLARTLATGETILDEELGFSRPDGSSGAIAVSTSPIRNAQGTVVAAVATFFDVTDRRRAAEALRESERRFRLLVESAEDFAIFLLDLEGHIVSWNPGAELITGYAEQEVIGQHFACLFTRQDRVDDAPQRELRRAAESGRALDERWHLRKDGIKFWASGVLSAAHSSDGALRGFVKIMRDQTEHRAFQARLEESVSTAEKLREAAEVANRAKDEFISTVSHELRTPLNTIRLWSNMLSTGRVPLTQGSEGVKAVERAAIAQQQLIDDLLDVSRMATGKLRLVARDIVLAQAVADAIEAVRPIAERRNVSLETEIGEDVGIVHVDPDRMQQVVWNLLTNAVKFTPSGGHVRVSLRRIADDVDIVVTDTGIGIRRDVVPHIFERFRQADSGTTRQHGGLGLGLAIAKQLVELHGGTIGVESEGEGRGASFRVRLPNLKRLPGEAQSDSTRVQLSLDLSGVDVLLVEDEEPARAATARLLEMHGAQVRMVTTVAGAREAFAMQRPDVIVADVGLPGEDGYSLMRSIRQLELAQNTASVPAIAVTAFARPEDRRAALEAGFSDHVPKPLDPARFIVAIANLLRSR